MDRARAAPRAGAVGPRARLRRPLRAPQRRPAARAAAAPDPRGLARRPRPPACCAVPRGGGAELGDHVDALARARQGCRSPAAVESRWLKAADAVPGVACLAIA